MESKCDTAKLPPKLKQRIENSLAKAIGGTRQIFKQTPNSDEFIKEGIVRLISTITDGVKYMHSYGEKNVPKNLWLSMGSLLDITCTLLSITEGPKNDISHKIGKYMLDLIQVIMKLASQYGIDLDNDKINESMVNKADFSFSGSFYDDNGENEFSECDTFDKGYDQLPDAEECKFNDESEDLIEADDTFNQGYYEIPGANIINQTYPPRSARKTALNYDINELNKVCSGALAKSAEELAILNKSKEDVNWDMLNFKEMPFKFPNEGGARRLGRVKRVDNLDQLSSCDNCTCNKISRMS